MAVRKIYIAEGADLVGKSEISQFLCNIFGWTYYKNIHEGKVRFGKGEDPKLAFKYETNIAFNFFEQLPSSINLMCDRFTPSEFAYSKTLNRPFDEELVWYYDRKLANKFNAKLLYFYQPTIREDFEDEFVSRDIQEKVKEYYEEYLSKTKCKFCRIDTSSRNLNEELIQIIKSRILED